MNETCVAERQEELQAGERNPSDFRSEEPLLSPCPTNESL